MHLIERAPPPCSPLEASSHSYEGLKKWHKTGGGAREGQILPNAFFKACPLTLKGL